ncbi:hypothetical protein BpHYR1_047225 [Brachionus plicatilis]|uniref:Uncharacterized protein n=1 Tax=Brachionus plicatilis TaxID=10195 RepID=A0A3M7T555_BRAPC|nr:hypothetical protein BpHYR1_047225 [Brachionus plicatilis]
MSSENECKKCCDSASSKLIQESDLVIDSLNSIIDSHSDTPVNTNKNFVQNILRKSESFRKLTSFAHKKSARQVESSHTISSSTIETMLGSKMEPEPAMSKKDKFKSKSYFINSANSPCLRKTFMSDSPKKVAATCSTSYINPPKKKRSSLFNLFSFSKSSSGSSQNIENHESDYYNLGDYDNVFSDTEHETNQRPQSECIASPDWHRSLKFFSNKKSYKLAEKQRSHERSSAVSFKSDESVHGTITKRQLVRCKGFSVPLNASYCPNSSSLWDDLNIGDENKLSIRLKYAEIKNLDDEFSEENQNFAQADPNNLETLDRLNSQEETEHRCCSPSPSILTLSLNNKCSTATKALDQNLNSINFVNNPSADMSSQLQTKTNEEDVNQLETDSAESARYRKKRFQQFQTQSLIDLNVQLVKKSEQCVDNLKQNDNSTTKSIRNPLFKLNNYQTIDEDSYSKLKQFYSSSSNFFHNDEAMSEVTIHTSSNSKPVQKNIKLRKGQMLK